MRAIHAEAGGGRLKNPVPGTLNHFLIRETKTKDKNLQRNQRNIFFYFDIKIS